MFVQTFLRTSGTLTDLENRFSISATVHREYPNLVLLKYDQIASPFDEPIVQDCRGIILDQADNWKIVNFSMRKFFNHGEPNASVIDWATARCLEKMDGSLIQIYSYNQRWQVASSGSPDAGGRVGDNDFTFAELFWRVFATYSSSQLPPVNCGKCFFFELMTPFNQIVVPHPTSILCLLGGRDLTTLQELTLAEAATFFPDIPVVQSFNLSTIDQCLQSFNSFSGHEQEGYVVVDAQFNRIKIKHPRYVQLHHLKGNINSTKALVEIVRTGEIDELSAYFPEYQPILLATQSKYEALITELETAYQKICSIPIQRDFAREARKTRCSTALFAVRARKALNIRSYLQMLRIETLMELLDSINSN
jgi:hypothetical protein